MAQTVRTTEPVAHGLPGHGWTLKKVRAWVLRTLGIKARRSTLHRLLRQAQLRWKKFKKLLGKANPKKRAEYVRCLDALYARCRRGEVVLIWADESHFHRDMDPGSSWCPVGQRAWRASDGPSLAERINWYGAYDFGAGQCLIWNHGSCNGGHTAEFLEQVAAWQKGAGKPVVVIWDGAPWHRAKVATRKAAGLKIELVPLPGYSPDLNPIEQLWKWMREEVTSGHCHDSLRALFDACKAFVGEINATPLEVIDRLWPKFELDSDANPGKMPMGTGATHLSLLLQNPLWRAEQLGLRVTVPGAEFDTCQ